MAIRCLIVDDDEQFLRAARDLLEHDGIHVVGIATTSAEAVRLANERRPDVALIAIVLGPGLGFDLARALAQTAAEPRVIMISTYAETDFEEMIAASPAIGYVFKSELSGRAVRTMLKAGTTT